jgi:predicted DCC family thiol-disulfide oxidoreductase YuxK
MLFCLRLTLKVVNMINVFYDDRCPLCRREIEYYKKLSAFTEINWSGISENIPTLEKYGISHTESLKVLHAINEDNQMVYGVDTFILIWQQLPKWKWIAKFVELPLIYQLSKGIYRIFAKWRFKNLDHCTIE